MPRKPKQERSRIARRRFLTAARKKFGRKGLGVSRSKIGQSIGRNGFLINYYFGSKKALIREVVAEIISEREDLAQLRKSLEGYANDPDARVVIESVFLSKPNRKRKKRG